MLVRDAGMTPGAALQVFQKILDMINSIRESETSDYVKRMTDLTLDELQD